MKGLWKESLGGWDRKCIKRKAQSRKHALKDNAEVIYRKFAYSETKDGGTVYKVEVEYKADCINHYNKKEFVYNKPFGTFERRKFFTHTEYKYEKKAFKKIANKKERRNVKAWIVKGNYDEAVPSKCTSPFLYS